MYDSADTRAEDNKRLKRLNDKYIRELAVCKRALRRTRAQLHQCQLKLKSAEFKNKKYKKEIIKLSNLLEDKTTPNDNSGYEDYGLMPKNMFDNQTENTVERKTQGSAEEKNDSFSENFLPYKLKL